MAHPERNYSIIRSPETLLNILTKIVHVQITGASILGDYGRDIQLCAYFMDSGNVDIIASDAHGGKIRPPMLSAARDAAARRLGKKAADRLVITNPAAVLNGEAIDRKNNRKAPKPMSQARIVVLGSGCKLQVFIELTHTLF
ncbi:MAG: CpsB/CapC family capsule biosynthesis tyrosine phosphatase [Desulfobacterales bacterium]